MVPRGPNYVRYAAAARTVSEAGAASRRTRSVSGSTLESRQAPLSSVTRLALTTGKVKLASNLRSPSFYVAYWRHLNFP
jgi:hypothetical protein